MKNFFSAVLPKIIPWLLGGVVVVGVPFAYLTITHQSLRDLLYRPEITISDGNVVKKYSNGREEILVDKSDYEDVIVFSSVTVSPDKEKMCFVSQTLAPMWLYWSHIDGSDVEKVAVAQNCVWSHNSEMIAYINHTTDVSAHNVFYYTLSTGESKNLTGKVNSEDLMRVYRDPAWSDDDSTLTSYYIVTDFENMTQNEGTSEIDIETGEITEI